MNARVLKAKMRQLNWTPKKKWGQCFLVNSQVINQIASEVKSLKPDQVVEIGPGLGALTYPLTALKRPLVLIEKDRVLAQHLKTQGLDVRPEDALRFCWKTLSLTSRSVVVGNLPYQIASRLLLNCTDLKVKHLLFMFQEEVAKRILSPHGVKSYGLLSVMAQCYWSIRSLIHLGKRDFYPAPEVNSRLLLFKKKQNAPGDSEQFLNFLKLCFHNRRKQLFKKLKNHFGEQTALKSYNRFQMPLTFRVQDLSPLNLLDLFEFFKKCSVFPKSFGSKGLKIL